MEPPILPPSVQPSNTEQNDHSLSSQSPNVPINQYDMASKEQIHEKMVESAASGASGEKPVKSQGPPPTSATMDLKTAQELVQAVKNSTKKLSNAEAAHLFTVGVNEQNLLMVTTALRSHHKDSIIGGHFQFENNKEPLEFCRERKNLGLMKVLIEHGFKPSKADYDFAVQNDRKLADLILSVAQQDYREAALGIKSAFDPAKEYDMGQRLVAVSDLMKVIKLGYPIGKTERYPLQEVIGFVATHAKFPQEIKMLANFSFNDAIKLNKDFSNENKSQADIEAMLEYMNMPGLKYYRERPDIRDAFIAHICKNFANHKSEMTNLPKILKLLVDLQIADNYRIREAIKPQLLQFLNPKSSWFGLVSNDNSIRWLDPKFGEFLQVLKQTGLLSSISVNAAIKTQLESLLNNNAIWANKKDLNKNIDNLFRNLEIINISNLPDLQDVVKSLADRLSNVRQG